jgi:transposase
VTCSSLTLFSRSRRMRKELAVEHLAIDLGGRESQVCIRSEDGTILLEQRMPTAALDRYLRRRPTSRVVVETCTEAFAVADSALAAGHEVRVVPGQLVRSLGVGARGVKSDRNDARALSQVSCRIDLPSVHIPSSLARERKALCGMREALVESRTKLINTVQAWMRGQVRRPAPGHARTIVKRVRAAVQDRPPYVERLLESIEELAKRIHIADGELAALAESDTTCRRLMTVPGVGPVTATRFAATVDAVGRFASAHQLESYLGLVPGERSSGERRHSTSITKAGPAKMRWALVQACWVAKRCARKDPMILWAEEIEKRRGKRIAVTALARKMAGILYAIWRDGTTYDPGRGATRLTAGMTETEPTSKILERAAKQPLN